MSKNLKQIVKLVLLVTCCMLMGCSAIAKSISYHSGNIRLLDKYNFEEGGYAVLGIIQGGHPKERSVGNFYTDDIDLLNELKKTWVTGKPVSSCLCASQYEIYIVKNGKVHQSFGVILEESIESVIIDWKSYYFDPENLSRYRDRFKELDIKEHQFETLQAARQFLKELSPDPNLLLYWEPPWAEYDGTFFFYLPCGRAEDDKCLENLRLQISEKYPNRKFELHCWGRSHNRTDPSKDSIGVNVWCEKLLYSEFDLYPNFSEWDPFPLNLKMYYKSSAN